jgi:DNA-directed RNA polymerase I and III subunit RPAC2
MQSNPIHLNYTGNDNTAVTVIFTGEDHTLGNTLRHLLGRQPSVEFAAYSVPHPLAPRMNLRVQTVKDDNSTNAISELNTALDNAEFVFSEIERAFSAELANAKHLQE